MKPINVHRISPLATAICLLAACATAGADSGPLPAGQFPINPAGVEAAPALIHVSIPDPRLAALARIAVASDNPEAAAAINELRAAGPDALKTMIEVHKETIAARGSGAGIIRGLPGTQPDNDDWERLKAALNQVAGQYDSHAAGLYWFTDLKRAAQEAASSGKPILSLRLLGRLDEDQSCANSRFFRVALYANKTVSAYLRDHYVLHWESVRPVPKLTIDFGDGRQIERTITGNSFHYILDAAGGVIDAIPGMHGPERFIKLLSNAHDLAARAASLPAPERAEALGTHHRNRLDALAASWASDLGRAGIEASHDRAELARLTTADVWTRIAALHMQEARIDGASRGLMREKHPNAFAAGRIAISKAYVEDPLLRAVANFERSISEDMVRNEYLVHGRIHEWLAAEAPRDLKRFTSKVYGELFLMPDNDPWLGLVPADSYAALDNEGLVQFRPGSEAAWRIGFPGASER